MVRSLRYTSHRPWCLLLLLLCSDQGGELAMLFSGSRISCCPPKVRRQGRGAPILGSRESFNCDVLARDEDVEPHISRSSHCAHFTQEKIRAPKNHSEYSRVPTKTAISWFVRRSVRQTLCRLELG